VMKMSLRLLVVPSAVVPLAHSASHRGTTCILRRTATCCLTPSSVISYSVMGYNRMVSTTPLVIYRILARSHDASATFKARANRTRIAHDGPMYGRPRPGQPCLPAAGLGDGYRFASEKHCNIGGSLKNLIGVS
jgi:hypothetical protein